MSDQVHQHDHPYLSGLGVQRLLPFYDLVGFLLGMRTDHGALVEQADPPRSGQVLEIGCGTGNLALLAKRMRPDLELVGIDPDRAAVDRATRKAGGRVRFDHGYGQELPYPDESFDRVLSAFMLHHLTSEVRSATLAESRRVLRPGGSLHVVDLGGHVHASNGVVARRQLRSQRLADNLGDAIPEALRAAGFTEVTERGHRHARLGRVTYYRATR
ncbi:class I SAM-dependent methyltransferase [Pseudonocardia spinosispora]|uniref:class I SAM-dependent methyltransferase n=1 Tax=Pseudonocardia spinosispora TaxID=103441 RepID=UPI00040814EA|nr:class I SAM-dependent methyltransferase [Pseudonocardia spinosispora]